MKIRSSGTLECLGAVIGAGFVSGREIVSFFSRYGQHSWWLIVLAVGVMILLCNLCMKQLSNTQKENSFFFSRYRKKNHSSGVCLLVMLFILAGAMTAAAGHMISLLIPSKIAYPVGIVGTLCIAWLLGKGNMKSYSFISFVLTAMFLMMILLALRTGSDNHLLVSDSQSAGELVKAAFYAVGYGAMNITVSIGVICRNGDCCQREKNRRSALIGLMLCGLLFVSNTLYLQHPEVMNMAFPIVPFFQSFGRTGYLMCLLMLYLAILTTLIAVILVLRNGMEQSSLSGKAVMPLTLGIPAVISCLGFSGIVDHLYAPAGLICFAIIFLPLLGKRSKNQLDIS